jgi:hypothetical protein
MKFVVKTDTSPLRKTLCHCYCNCKLILQTSPFTAVIPPRAGISNPLSTSRLCQQHCTDRRSRIKCAMTLVGYESFEIISAPEPAKVIPASGPGSPILVRFVDPADCNTPCFTQMGDRASSARSPRKIFNDNL